MSVDSPALAQESTAEFLHSIISSITSHVPADLVCIYTYNQDTGHLENLVEQLPPSVPEHVMAVAGECLNQHIQRLAADSQPLILNQHQLQHYGVYSVLVFPLTMPERLIGAVVLVACKPDVYRQQHTVQLRHPITMIQTALENRVLKEELTVAQSLVAAGRAIARNPSPQNVVNILRDHLFDSSVSSCAIMLYGPQREDRPNGPFSYLELKGVWSRRHGSATALGVKYPIDDYPAHRALFEGQKYLFFTDMTLLADLLDPFWRAMLEIEDVHSLAVVPLQADHRHLGVLVVTSAAPFVFTPQQLRSYQAVGEFLTISTQADILQKQHDFVQQGRAALLDAVTDGVVMVLPDADNGRVLTINQRFTGLFNLSEDEAQGFSLDNVLDRMRLTSTVRRDLRRVWSSIPVDTPTVQCGEFSFTHSSGRHMDIGWYSAPVYQGSYVLGRIYIFHDATAERSAERLRYRLLSRISHELRTPLTSISGFASLILESTGDQLPDLAREYTEIILNSARHLNRVFIDMIELSRANSGELQLNMQNAHLPDIIIESVARLELQYKDRGQTVIMELDDDLPGVQADVDRIAQVLTNLVGNAIKFSPENSRIRIVTRLIDSPDSLPDGAPPDMVTPCILVTVIDEGEGVSKDDAEKVFLPFYRTEAARVNKIEGTGLGLAFARSIIEMHRGKIWTQPARRSRRGGHFLFTIPTLP